MDSANTALHNVAGNASMITGVTATAQVSIAALRALFTDQPRLVSSDGSQPPPIEPMSAAR